MRAAAAASTAANADVAAASGAAADGSSSLTSLSTTCTRDSGAATTTSGTARPGSALARRRCSPAEPTARQTCARQAGRGTSARLVRGKVALDEARPRVLQRRRPWWPDVALRSSCPASHMTCWGWCCGFCPRLSAAPNADLAACGARGWRRAGTSCVLASVRAAAVRPGQHGGVCYAGLAGVVRMGLRRVHAAGQLRGYRYNGSLPTLSPTPPRATQPQHQHRA